LGQNYRSYCEKSKPDQLLPALAVLLGVAVVWVFRSGRLFRFFRFFRIWLRAWNADAEIRLQAYDGGAAAWKTVSQLTNDAGNSTFTADWHTQFNRILVNGGSSPSDGDLRIEVTNVSGGAGDYSADGDER